MFKINIPQPCHEDWNAMTPGMQGRHCAACEKTVVDFTSMTDGEVKHYLLNKAEEKVCGRFKNSQLQQVRIEVPNNIFEIEMPLWKKFLAACLIAFSSMLFSCDTQTTGKMIIDSHATGHKQESCNITMGLPRQVDTSLAVKPDETVTTTTTIPDIPAIVTGEIEIGPPYPETTSVKPVAVTDTIPLPVKDTLPGKIKKEKNILQPEEYITMGAVAMVPAKKNPPVADTNSCEGKIMY